MSNNLLLQFLSSERVSSSLLYWINSFPFNSCQGVEKLTDLRDTVALSEILVNIDENYFKDLKSSKSVDKNLWLVHLVQLKKLFLKLSAYVELYLKQDWSLLPVPDFKLVAKSEEITSHLNFMVASVLLTVTHSGRNWEFEQILESVIPKNIRKEIQLIQDAFSMALEPKSPKSSTNSPRKSFLITNDFGIVPKVLFPSNLSIESENLDEEESLEINVQEIKESARNELENVKEIVKTMNPELDISRNTNNSNSRYNADFTLYCTSDCTAVSASHPHSHEFAYKSLATTYPQSHPSHSQVVELQNEIKLLEIKLLEMEKVIKKSKEIEDFHSETVQNLSETKLKLNETTEEMRKLREQTEYEKIERNSLLTSFDAERQNYEDEIQILRKLIDENCTKLIKEKNESEENNGSDLNQLDQHLQLPNPHSPLHISEIENLKSVLNESKSDNSKLVKALKKARDHIINQDSIIKELKEALQTSESKIQEREEEIKILKVSYEEERIKMNEILINLGNSIQRTNL